MKATRVLDLQHVLVTSLINRLLRRRAGRNRVVNELADSFAAHLLVEEEILYPVARTIQRRVIDQAVEEHDLMAIEMQRILATPRNAPEFEVRLAVLRSLLLRHVSIEDEVVFPTLDQLLTASQNEALGRQVVSRYNQVLPAGSQEILSMRETQISCPEPGTIEPIERPGRRRRRARRQERRS